MSSDTQEALVILAILPVALGQCAWVLAKKAWQATVLPDRHGS